MPKNGFKEAVQAGLPVLAGIVEIKVLWCHGDVGYLIQDGAVLLAIATIEDKDGLGPFRYALGWPRSAGKKSDRWTHYGQPLQDERF